jgi:hypothetical protein
MEMGNAGMPGATSEGPQVTTSDDPSNGAGTAGTADSAGTAGAAGAPGASGASGAAGMDGGEPGPCDIAGTWRPVSSALPPTDGRIPVRTPAGRVGVVSGAGHAPCDAVLISSDVILAVDCPLAYLDVFSLSSDSLVGNAPVSLVQQYAIGAVLENQSGPGTLAQLKESVPFVRTASLPCTGRAPLAGEGVHAVSHAGDGLARSAEVTLELSAFDDLRSLPTTLDPGRISSVFGLDGQLLAFCAFENSCAKPSSCVSLATLIQGDLILRGACAMTEMLWGDTTGDGIADGVVINRGLVAVRRTPTKSSQLHEVWAAGVAFGTERNLLADFDGDHRADLANVNFDGVVIRRSSGALFEAPAVWFKNFILSSQPISAADVDGDGRADLISVIDHQIQVRASTGKALKIAENWASDLALPVRTLSLGDVDGDGRADAIIARTNEVWVRLSTGSSFQPEQLWLNGVAPGAPGWFFADLNGDSKTDAVTIDATGSRVFLSDGTQFLAPAAPWTPTIPLGERGNDFADINGDGKADALVKHDFSTLYYASLGDRFADKAIWIEGAYYGGIP